MPSGPSTRPRIQLEVVRSIATLWTEARASTSNVRRRILSPTRRWMPGITFLTTTARTCVGPRLGRLDL